MSEKRAVAKSGLATQAKPRSSYRLLRKTDRERERKKKKKNQREKENLTKRERKEVLLLCTQRVFRNC